MQAMWQVDLKLRADYSESDLAQQAEVNRRAWRPRARSTGCLRQALRGRRHPG